MKEAIIYIMVIVLLVATNIAVYMALQVTPEEVSVKTDTIYVVDTVIVSEPVVRDSIIIKYVTRKLEQATADGDTARTEEPDSVKVKLPIMQMTYETSQYKAWVSGYEARLDSIMLFQKCTIVNTETVRTRKQRRWGCYVGVGMGAGKDGLTPIAGISLGYRLF